MCESVYSEVSMSSTPLLQYIGGLIIARKKTVVEDLPRIKQKKAHQNLIIKLPVPPSINHMYVNTRGGGKRLTKQAEEYTRISKALINLAIDEQRWKICEKGNWIYIDLIFYFPDKRVRDASNCLKLLLDVMQGTVYINDMYAMPRIQSVEYDKDNPRVEINIHSQTEKDRSKAIELVCT